MINNSKGQVLLFIMVVTVITLGMGVAVSQRAISSIARSSRTDTSLRSLAAAEAGAEHFLGYSFEELDNLSNVCKDEATSLANITDCVIYLPYDGSVNARAIVTIAKADTTSAYKFYGLDNMQVQQLTLTGYGKYPVDVCWKHADPAEKADLSYILLDKDGKLTKGYVRTSGSKTQVASNPSTFTQNAGSNHVVGQDYDNCVKIETNVSGLSEPYILRFRPVRGNISYGTFIASPFSSGFPSQGYTITSIGELDVTTDKPVRRVVKVTRTYPYAGASFFDFALFSDQGKVIAE